MNRTRYELINTMPENAANSSPAHWRELSHGKYVEVK